MREKTLIWISVFILLVIAIFVLFWKKDENEYFNQVILTSNNTINNNTLPKYIDTILSIGLDAAGLVDVVLVVNPMSESAKTSIPDYELRAHVREWDGIFYLFIGNIRRDEAIKVLSHEIIHIHQYYSGELSFIDGKVYWEGEEYDLTNTEYDKRPWEQNAFDREVPLSNAIESILTSRTILTSNF